jgi:hypothetical protein
MFLARLPWRIKKMNKAVRPEIKYILKSARTGRATVAVNVRESPIAYYFSRGWIDEYQRDAGEIFRDLWEGSLIGTRAINWESVYGARAKEGLKPQQAEALHELKRVLRHTNKVGRALLISVCGEGRAVTEFEEEAGWRKRHGIERLREALDDVAECRGLITRKLRNVT